MFVVWDDTGVFEVELDGAARLSVPAGLAPRRSAMPEVGEQGVVRLGATSALHPDSVTRGRRANDDKVAEAVANAWQRVLALEATRLASSQEVPQSTR